MLRWGDGELNINIGGNARITDTSCKSSAHLKGFLAILRKVFLVPGGFLLRIKTMLLDLRVIVHLLCIGAKK